MSKLDFTKKPILGMLHLAGQDPLLRAMKETGIMFDAGVDGVIVENYHGSIDDMDRVLEHLWTFALRHSGLSIGLNVLPNDYIEALRLANKWDVDFIQLDYVSGIYNRVEMMDYSKFEHDIVNAKPQILGGVWPKYYEPVKGSILACDIADAKPLTDAIVVTGAGTGKETPLDKIRTFKEFCGLHPLIIGAGMTPSNVAEQLSIADGAIVGSCFKPYNRTTEMVDKVLVKEFMDEVKKVRK